MLTPFVGVALTLRGLFDTKAGDRIDELLRRFGELKEGFDRGVGVQVMSQVLSAGEVFRPIYRTHV